MSKSSDPIFAVIEAHGAAGATFGRELDSHDSIEKEHEREAEARRLSDIEQAALATLAGIVPTTREGAIALLSYLAEVEREANREFTDDAGERDFFFYAAMENVARAFELVDYGPGDDPGPGDEYPDNDNGEPVDAVAA